MDEIRSSPATPESIWEIIREISLSIKESRAEIAESRAEIAESRAEIRESRAEIRESRAEIRESSARFDRELAASRAEFKQELAASRAEFKQEMAASRAEYDRRSAEAKQEMAESRAEFDRQIKNVNEMIGGIGNSNGKFAEEFFFTALYKGDRNLFGEHFDECYTQMRRYEKATGKKAEHDIFLVNCVSLAIVEIKYKAQRADIQKILNRLPDFKTLFIEHKERRIFLGLAAMSFEDGVEEEAEKAGIAIVKQIGEAVIFNDEHVKAF